MTEPEALSPAELVSLGQFTSFYRIDPYLTERLRAPAEGDTDDDVPDYQMAPGAELIFD